MSPSRPQTPVGIPFASSGALFGSSSPPSAQIGCGVCVGLEKGVFVGVLVRVKVGVSLALLVAVSVGIGLGVSVDHMSVDVGVGVARGSVFSLVTKAS
jgi:hypothetical protein